MKTTDEAVVNGKLTNEALGALTRKFDEIKRRVEGGTIPLKNTLNALQDIIEGKVYNEYINSHFAFIDQFNIVVPEGYTHPNRLTTFNQRYGGEFYFYDGDITDQNFSAVSTVLIPGRKLRVKLFAIQKVVTSQDCLAIYKRHDAILAGAQGGSLLYETSKDKLPKGKFYFSFDEKDRLWEDEDAGGDHKVPSVHHYSDGDWGFNLSDFDRGLTENDVLAVFCDCY